MAPAYGIPAVREAMDSLQRLDGLEETQRILRHRVDRIATRTMALLRAGSDLATVVASAQDPTTAQLP